MHDKSLLAACIQCNKRIPLLVFVVTFLWVAPRANGEESQEFQKAKAVLQRYCAECHEGESAEADVDLIALQPNIAIDAADHLPDHDTIQKWLRVREILATSQMPPPEADQPSEQELADLTLWLTNYLRSIAQHQAGDPGPVLVRRLTNSEYNYTIRDLTGLESLDPTHEFPIDGAAGEGFTNVGSGQGMSPALAEKYLGAAKEVAKHLVLLPDGIGFSTALSRRDRSDELVARIQSFYRKYTVDGHATEVDLQGVRFATNQGGVLPLRSYFEAVLDEKKSGLSAGYLELLRAVLDENQTDSDGVRNPWFQSLRKRWQQLSATPQNRDELLDQLVVDIESVQSQLWRFNTIGHLANDGSPRRWAEPIPDLTIESMAQSIDLLAQSGAGTVGLSEENVGDINRWLDQFRGMFPPVLCYTRLVPVDEAVTFVLFHREDDLLKRLVLSDPEIQQLDRLWDELLFVSQEPLQLAVTYEQIVQFATQDRPDLVEVFGPLEPKIKGYAEEYRQRCLQLEPIQVESLLDFAARSWRRPLSTYELDTLKKFYRRQRDQAATHEEAMARTLAFIFTSPKFLYKLEQPVEGLQPAPINQFELAARLSYFLWSSAPDPTLSSLAASEKLREPDQLSQEVERLLKDARVERLAIEFGCQWLHVRDFDQNEEKNETLFPEFAELRGDMYQETIRFFVDLFQRNGSILEILDADHTFLNARLAAHYRIPWPSDWPNDEHSWKSVKGVRQHARGGVLGMATVLACQSGASRTSPILRGNWVYETLLGQRLPNPPPGVPILPETPPEGLSERELIEQHSSQSACARCHVKIDPYGFALEQFDPLGRLRIGAYNSMATLESGETIDGLDGLRTHLLEKRKKDFVRQWCRKLFGYALGRELQLADEPLLDQLIERVEADDYRVWTAVLWIAESLPFQQIRGMDAEH